MAAGSRRSHRAVLAPVSPYQGSVWTAALGAAGIDVQRVDRPGAVAQFAAAAGPADANTLLVLDLQRIAEESLDLIAYAQALRERAPARTWIAMLGARVSVSASARALARAVGACDLVALVDHRDLPSLRALSDALSQAGVANDAGALYRMLESAPPRTLPPAVTLIHAAGTTVQALVERMRGSDGVDRADRRYAGKTYADCFIGSEALDWLAGALGASRTAALEVGQCLLEYGVFHHVVKDHPFRDERLFYRFVSNAAALEAIVLEDLVKQMWSPRGLAVAPRTYRGKTYDDCFVGSEAVDWIVRRYALSREDAVTLGQQLVDLGLAHHVVDEHPFKDGHYFFRFRRHEYA
jgi:hypothetical protein